MDADLAFCLECFADHQINRNLQQTEKEVAQLKTEERRVLKRLDRDDTNVQHEINIFCENVRENEKKLGKNRRLIEDELRKILQVMSVNLDKMSAASLRGKDAADLRAFSNQLRHQLDQFDSEMTQLIDLIDQSTSSNFHRRLATWIDEHLDYMKDSKKIPKDLFSQYSNDRVQLWNERSKMIDEVTERLSLKDLSIRQQLNYELHDRSRNTINLIQHLRSFIEKLHAKEKSGDQQMLDEIQASIKQKRGEQQTRAVALVDALRQLAVGSENFERFEKKFDQVMKQTDDFVPILLGRIDQPTEKSLPLTLRLDADFQTWSENRSSIQQSFCADLCQALEIPVNSIRTVAVEQGSAVLHAYVQAPHGRKVLDILSVDPNERSTPAAAVKFIDRMKCVAIKYKSPLTSVKVGEFGVKTRDYLMDARWNRIYTRDRTQTNSAFWVGALDRGGKPYYCPEGWVRFGIKVAEDDQAFNARWGSWHIGYHGTRGSVAPIILISGLRTSVKGCFEIKGRTSVYLSPSIEYAAHPRYALPWRKYNGKQEKYYQLVFQCRVNPKSVGRAHPETLLDEKSKNVKIDRNFNNNELEWVIPSDKATVTYIRDNIICYGMMIRMSDCDPASLPSSNWWKDVCVKAAEYESV